MFTVLGPLEILLVLVVPFWLLNMLLVAYVAGQKQRSQIAWFVLGAVLPLFALIAVAGLPSLHPRVHREIAPLRNGSLVEEPDGTLWLLVDGQREDISRNHRKSRERLERLGYDERLEWFRNSTEAD
jgi:hypothetical protein